MNPVCTLLSCEHAVNFIPEEFQNCFDPHQALLATHRGMDFGALAIATHLSEQFHWELIQANTSRLLIDCNRSLNNPDCFSPITSTLSTEDKQRIIQHYYQPYRETVEKRVASLIAEGFHVCHLSIHSFTPQMNGVTRNTDIAFLYDPKRPSEQQMARAWKTLVTPTMRARLNYPYKGTSDGFTTHLRKLWPDEVYTGIEVESNQALTMVEKSLNDVKEVLENSLRKLFSLTTGT